MMDRRSAAAAAVLAACLWGCNDVSPPSPYKTYDQLLTNQGAATDADSSPDPNRTGPTDDATDPFAEPSETPVSALDCDNAADDAVTSRVGNSSAAPVPSTAATAANGPFKAKSLASFVPKPGGIQLLVPETKFRAEGPEGALRVNYDDLDLFRVLNMEPVPDDAVDYFPDWLKDLAGKRIRIRGFMLPTFESTGLEQFVLTRDTGECCFGPNAKIYYLIGVKLRPGKTVDYMPNRPFDVVGNFHIEMLAEGGKQFGLYWIDDAQVIRR
jgi:hypothetical protein